MVGGSALKGAADAIIEKAQGDGRHLMEADAADLEFKDGKFRVAGTDKPITLVDVAKAFYAPVGPIDRQVRHRPRCDRQLRSDAAEPSRTAATWSSSRSIPRPARSTSTATTWSTTSAG